MTQYRKELEKLYNRITKVVSKGSTYTQRYYDLIEEIVSNGQFELLQDVYIRKFKIDITRFANINDLKKNTFKRVANTLQSKTNQDLQNLFITKEVFPTGSHFYDATTGNYLGDIRQFDGLTFSQGLEVTTFYPSDLSSAIPNFPTKITSIIPYNVGVIVYYNQQLYKCINSYTWSRDEQITPTFSNYWMDVFPGTQSYTQIVNPTDTLVNRYSDAIDVLRTYSYPQNTPNEFMEIDYVENYFE